MKILEKLSVQITLRNLSPPETCEDILELGLWLYCFLPEKLQALKTELFVLEAAHTVLISQLSLEVIQTAKRATSLSREFAGVFLVELRRFCPECF